MSIFTQPKIDAHCHVLDPDRFPYPEHIAYRPCGQEVGPAAYFRHVMACHQVRHALLVGPNSGYGTDNRCLLDALGTYPGVFKGIAVLPNDADTETLQRLQAQGVIGVAFNPSLMGLDFYADIEPLLRRLRQLGMWAQFQVEKDQLTGLLPMLSRVDVKVMFDHCGRPDLRAGLAQPGFQALLALGREGRALVKLSGFAKFSQTGFPFDDTRPYVLALARDFGLGQCVWASDWPYLKAPYRLDYGPVLQCYEGIFSAAERQQLMWDSPRLHFGFGSQA
jgi:predicted TIM-barrel fold metal-dependent hydrolase